MAGDNSHYLNAAFSRTKSLWPYQVEALQRVQELLLRYYADWQQSSPDKLKERLVAYYRLSGVVVEDYNERFDRKVGRHQNQAHALLREYGLVDGPVLPFQQVCNRAGFWMATGSGKTLLIVKLVELLADLMSDGAIPHNDILILSHRDELLDQISKHVDEYNAARPKRRIVLEDLRRYPETKRQQSLLRDQEIVVFQYNSDNLTTEQKDREVDFRNYENGGRWYIILDEAHRGKHGESTRKAIFTIMSRNGFLFNFSATLTDPLDRATRVYDLNLSEFVNRGYGKHIALLQEDTSEFAPRKVKSSTGRVQEELDYTDFRKQLIVLKSLLLLTYIKRARAAVSMIPYHSPLLVVFVNSVNVEGADLELFFRELERIGRGDVDASVLEQAKLELINSLRSLRREFEGTPALSMLQEEAIRSFTLSDVLQEVFNASGAGSTEAILSAHSDQEVAFKLKSGDRPYLLVRIGQIQTWLREKLVGVEVSESVEDRSFFQSLSAEDSPINILLGSRTFYEGWDSSRPNVAMYINIGKSDDAQKFVLQSMGRGVRIAPFPNTRGRFSKLVQEGHESALQLSSQHGHLASSIEPIETLFVFAASRLAMEQIVETINTVAPRKEWKRLDVVRNDYQLEKRPLLIPVYRCASKPLVELEEIRKFPIANDDLQLLQRYVATLRDDRILWAAHDYQPRDSRLLRTALSQPSEYFVTNNTPGAGQLDRLLARLKRHFTLRAHELDSIKPLEDEIQHYLQIQVSVDKLDGLQPKFDRVKRYPEVVRQMAGLSDREIIRQMKTVDRETSYDDVRILYLAEHYYYPILVVESDKVDYLKHVIKTESERRFIDELVDYIIDSGSFDCDWWMFSKLDEHLDRVYIPYYDRSSGQLREYHPDFVFWFQNGDEYTVVFVDPKGAAHTDYEYKVDGYRFLFEENGATKAFNYDGFRVRFLMKLYTKDAHLIAEQYRRYWIDCPSWIPINPC